MFKIKLLTLLFISFLSFSCTNKIDKLPEKYSVKYIDGEEYGLLLENFLISYLKSYGAYDPASNLIINANISHTENLFITNINNTSDRQKIISTINLNINDQINDCIVYDLTNSVEQFYIIASTVNFISNNKAADEIKKSNTEELVRDFIFELQGISLKCQQSII